MVAQDLERARRWGAPTGIGVALRASALVEGPQAPVVGLRSRRPASRRLAVATGPRSARSSTSARRCAAANRRADARVALRDGLERAERCRAGMLAAQARTELRAAGGPVSDPLGTGVEQLTVSERRVAELAAAGRSNPQIAQALYVTRKTVETHLGNVYRKLDIQGRGELAGALAGVEGARTANCAG